MPLTTLDTTEDRSFADGETVYDVDGNAYTVRGDYAELNINDCIRYNLSDDGIRNCFTRNRIREITDLTEKLRGLGCAVVVFTPDELGDHDSSQLEDVLVERGNNFLGVTE